VSSPEKFPFPSVVNPALRVLAWPCVLVKVTSYVVLAA